MIPNATPISVALRTGFKPWTTILARTRKQPARNRLTPNPLSPRVAARVLARPRVEKIANTTTSVQIQRHRSRAEVHVIKEIGVWFVAPLEMATWS